MNGPPPTYRDGVRAGLGFVLPTIAVATSFGVLAEPVIGATAAGVIALVAPALLAALVVTLTLGADRSGLTLDARLVGLLAAGAGLAARLPLLAVLSAAAIAAATARALS